MAARQIEVSVAPRFALRGQEPAGGAFLQAGGIVNPIRVASPADRFTVALSLADHLVHEEYHLELLDQDGEVQWTGDLPARALLGDAGTSVSIQGLAPGRYRLRLEGLRPARRLLAEYLLEVEAPEKRK
jgi:hypothetical protein